MNVVVGHGSGRRECRGRSMAIYYLNVKTVSRSQGRSVVAAAAYCSKSRLWDDRLGYECDFSGSGDAFYSEILLPQNAPERWSK